MSDSYHSEQYRHTWMDHAQSEMVQSIQEGEKYMQLNEWKI
jgi:hypothetical protein